VIISELYQDIKIKQPLSSRLVGRIEDSTSFEDTAFQQNVEATGKSVIDDAVVAFKSASIQASIVPLFVVYCTIASTEKSQSVDLS